MKKLIAFLLVLTLMTVSLAACDVLNIFSKEQETSAEETTTKAPEVTTKAPEETTTKAPEETTTKKPWVPVVPTPPPGDPNESVTDNFGNGELEFPQLPA